MPQKMVSFFENESQIWKKPVLTAFYLMKIEYFCSQIERSMNMIDQIIDYNKAFIESKGYEQFITDKYPDKKLAVLESWCSLLSCMDTRLTELLPAALGLKNGDAKIINRQIWKQENR